MKFLGYAITYGVMSLGLIWFGIVLYLCMFGGGLSP
jgi:hypothetical protein